MDLDCDALYKEHSKALLRFLRTRVSTEEAEEILQDTFVALLKTTSEFRGDCSMSTWLHTIALNVMKNRYKRSVVRGLHDTLSEDEVGENAHSIAELDVFQTVMSRDQIRLLDLAVSKMSDEFKDVFENVILNDEPYDAAAQRLNVPIGTIRSRVFRARQQLAQRLHR